MLMVGVGVGRTLESGFGDRSGSGRGRVFGAVGVGAIDGVGPPSCRPASRPWVAGIWGVKKTLARDEDLEPGEAPVVGSALCSDPSFRGSMTHEANNHAPLLVLA
jgi:hypothetical protein